MSILVLDADASRRSIMVERLRDFDGSDVASFSDAKDALTWSDEHVPDCVVFTNDISGMSTLEFFQSFRDMHRAPVPAILTGSGISADLRHAVLLLGASAILNEPFDVADVALQISNLVGMRTYDRDQSLTAEWFAEQVGRATSTIRERERETITRLARLAEYRSDESPQHILRVSQYCHAIASAADLGEEFAEMLSIAAPMHDVGKIAIPDYIIQKRGKLTEPEVELMRQHTTIGYEILSGSSSPLLQRAAEIALTHHEKYDGSGYPNGRARTDIPLGGRVCALADAFDSMTSDRPYRPAGDASAALIEIKRCSGSHFDPTLVEAFEAAFPSVVEVRQRLPDEHRE